MIVVVAIGDRLSQSGSLEWKSLNLYVPNSGPNKPQIERVSKKRKTSGKNWDPNLVYLQMIAFDCN